MSEIKVIDAMAHKLEPGSKYIIFIDSRIITEENAKGVNRLLAERGMKGLIVLTMGDPKNAVIVEEKEQ